MFKKGMSGKGSRLSPEVTDWLLRTERSSLMYKAAEQVGDRLGQKDNITVSLLAQELWEIFSQDARDEGPSPSLLSTSSWPLHQISSYGLHFFSILGSVIGLRAHFIRMNLLQKERRRCKQIRWTPAASERICASTAPSAPTPKLRSRRGQHLPSVKRDCWPSYAALRMTPCNTTDKSRRNQGRLDGALSRCHAVCCSFEVVESHARLRTGCRSLPAQRASRFQDSLGRHLPGSASQTSACFFLFLFLFSFCCRQPISHTPQACQHHPRFFLPYALPWAVRPVSRAQRHPTLAQGDCTTCLSCPSPSRRVAHPS